VAEGSGLPYGLSHKIPPEGETQMAYSLYDAAVTPCAQQLGALAGIIDKAAAHCATNKIEESALLQDRLYPDMFCLARQIRQSADFAMNTGGPGLPVSRGESLEGPLGGPMLSPNCRRFQSQHRADKRSLAWAARKTQLRDWRPDLL